MSTKHTPYFNLLEAIKEEGCPICLLSRKGVHKFMDDFLYESVNDPGLRKEIRESLGFCSRHTWQLQKFGDGFGLSIVYEDILRIISQNLKTKEKLSCIFCKQQRDIEGRYISVFIENFNDPKISHHYKNSFGFCLPHLTAAIKTCKNKTIAKEVIAIESAKITELAAELKEFIRKHDYRFSKEKFGKESDSWIRAIEKLNGKEGIY